jgi:hypothetical protein
VLGAAADSALVAAPAVATTIFAVELEVAVDGVLLADNDDTTIVVLLAVAAVAAD